MKTIIGIDLGTSTTEASVIRDGKPEMILNPDAGVITPSVIGLDRRGNWVVGEQAKAQLLLEPERTVSEVKRRIGTDTRIAVGNQSFSAAELQAKILAYVKTYASEALQEDITRAVISVPAYFDDRQRRETLKAGEMAGFTVERILNEPTAAALAYGLDHLDEESHILVYDLGGGTFDVTLLEMFDGVLEVKASSGDNQLGGKDFDEAVLTWLKQRFEAKHGLRLDGDLYAMTKLKDAAESAKIRLSEESETEILIPLLAEKEGKPLTLRETLSREQFQILTAGLLERTHNPIRTVLADAGISAEELDHIILVGGSTRMPAVPQDIETFLGKAPEHFVDPDYGVAQGAAIQAGIIEGTISQDDSILMTDVNPYTLGVEAAVDDMTGRMAVVIPRNVTIPVTREKIFSTYSPFQTAASIRVFQGESDIADSNHFLGEFEIGGIPPKPAHEEKIGVRFSYDMNGILKVDASILSTGKKASIEIRMLDELPEPERKDVSSWKSAPLAKRYRAVLRRAERKLKESGLGTLRTEDMEENIYLLKLAVLEGREEDAEELAEDILDMLEEEE